MGALHIRFSPHSIVLADFSQNCFSNHFEIYVYSQYNKQTRLYESLGKVSKNQNGNLRWHLPLGVQPPPPLNGTNFQTFFYPTFFFCNWILHIWNGFYTSKISLWSPLIIGSKLTFISGSGRWLPTANFPKCVCVMCMLVYVARWQWTGAKVFSRRTGRPTAWPIWAAVSLSLSDKPIFIFVSQSESFVYTAIWRSRTYSKVTKTTSLIASESWLKTVMLTVVLGSGEAGPGAVVAVTCQ